MEATPLEFSPEGHLAIHSSHDGVIKLWETSTNSLKSEYKPSSHLSATCSCLSWCQTNRKSEAPKRKKRRSGKRDSVQNVVDELSGLVAIGTVSGSILLYNVKTGELQSQLTNGHGDRVNGVVWLAEEDTFYSCASDGFIIDWQITAAKLKRKWLAHKGGVFSMCRCAGSHLLSAGRTIKLWDLVTKQALKTFTGHMTEVFRLIHVPVSEDNSVDQSYFLSAAVNDRIVNAWQITSSPEEKTSLASFSMPEEPVSMHVSSHLADRKIVLVVVTKCGKALIYEHTLNGKLKKPLTPKVTIQIAGECQKKEIPRPIQILAAYICDEEQHKLMLVHGNHLKPTFEKVSYSMSEPEMCLIREGPMMASSNRKDTSNVAKVRTGDVSKDLTVLVPGQMTPQLPTQEPQTTSRRKRKASVGEMTVEQRLNAISLEKPKAGPKQPPKADTLVTLLVQGLQSQDKFLLNNVLQNRDEKLIKNTVRKLPVQMVIPLVQELTKRMHGHAQAATVQVSWIQSVLAVHTSFLMTFPEIVDAFSSLYQMMDSRVNMLGKLSRLKGKLDIMLSQISAQTHEEEKGASQAPLLQFEEDSSDEDDLEEMAIGQGPSDSEPENWEDFSDDDSTMDTQEDINGKG